MKLQNIYTRKTR